LRDRFENLLFELRAHARQRAKLLIQAELFQIVDGGDPEMLDDERDRLRPEPLDFQQFKRRRWVFLKHLIAPLERPAIGDLGENRGHAFPDSGDVRDLLVGRVQQVEYPLRRAFDRCRRVAIAAYAERILARDLHQIGGLGK
jgi:hypothetical protein